MKANNLRPGNFVQWKNNSLNDGLYEKIESINHTEFLTHKHSSLEKKWWIETENCEGELLKNFVGILLTEDWLIKNGGERIGNLIRLRIGNFNIDFEHNDAYLNGYKIPCKYVHQLQNLYFALTGEELTVQQNKNKFA